MSEAKRKTDGLAIASFVVGVLPIALFAVGMLHPARDLLVSSLVLVCTGILLGLPAIVIGHVARVRLRRALEHSGKGLATAGLALGYINLALVVVLVVTVVSPLYSALRVKGPFNQCRDNVSRLAMAFKMYSNENHGEYPILSPESGRLMFDNGKSPLYPDYVNDLCLLVCPLDKQDWQALCNRKGEKDPNVLCDDHSYLYLGYVVTNDADVAAFAGAYQAQIANGGDFSGDLPVPDGLGTAGGNCVLRFREDMPASVLGEQVDPAAAARWQSRVPLLIERPENHPDATQVAYLDGHIELLPYPGKWPMTEKTIGILKTLAD